MSSKHRPLRVVVVSQHVSLLHELSWILGAVGYDVQTTNDFSEVGLWRRYSIADVVILDGRSIAEPTTATFTLDSDNSCYRIFLYNPSKPTDFSAWYVAGAHDALRTPISRGELLARVRTGARYLEFERRRQNQSSRVAVPGMFSRRGFLGKLRKLAASDEAGLSQHTLLMTSIDWYSGIRRKSGETGSQNLVNAAARAIKRAAGENSFSAYLGDGRFATLLLNKSPVLAKSTAESLGRDFCSRESHHDSVPRPTLTSAVVPWPEGCNAERFLNDAQETLGVAKHSGGGCVILQSDFNDELEAWKEEMTAGSLFANVVAQDIMEPLPAVLERDVDQSELAAAFHDSGIPVQPYVDRDGRLVGIVAQEPAAAETHIGLPGEPAMVTLARPETISHDASFPEIYEAFSSRACTTLVVTANDCPLGYLTCEGFLSMIDPIHTESFARTEAPPNDLKYLIVPSIIGEPAAV